MAKPPLKRRWPTRPPRRPDHVGTIGEVIRERRHVEIYCLRHGCHHHAPVDLQALRSEYGDDYTVSGFIARSRCSKMRRALPRHRHNGHTDRQPSAHQPPPRVETITWFMRQIV
jgi:hypothetical protein